MLPRRSPTRGLMAFGGPSANQRGASVDRAISKKTAGSARKTSKCR